MREDLKIQIDNTKKLVQQAVSRVRPHAFGHAYLWGTVEVKLKNKKSRYYKVLFGGVCAADLEECVKLAESVPGVSQVYYNID